MESGAGGASGKGILNQQLGENRENTGEGGHSVGLGQESEVKDVDALKDGGP